VLAHVPLFSGLPRRFLRRLADRMEEQRFMEGATVVRYGDPGDTFYVITEGEAKVQSQGGRTLTKLVPGDVFGEISLMDGGPRTATVVTETHLNALTLSRKDFLAALTAEPEVTVRLLKHAATLLRRQQRSTSN
jgi:CRP-like cAMP-binding protein